MPKNGQVASFINNFFASAAWDWFKQFAVPVVIPSAYAFWQWLRHRPLDWVGVGGLFLFSFIAVLLVFRNRPQSRRQGIQLKQSGGNVGIPTLSSLLGQAANITFDPNAFFARAYYSPITAEIEQNIKVLAAKHYPNDREGFYARFIGVGWVSYTHDETLCGIYGSQISALRELSNKVFIPLSAFKAHYDAAVPKFPSMYPQYTFEKWLNYLQERLLVLKHPSDMIEITYNGKDFLKYLAHTGRDSYANSKAF